MASTEIEDQIRLNFLVDRSRDPELYEFLQKIPTGRGRAEIIRRKMTQYAMEIAANAAATSSRLESPLRSTPAPTPAPSEVALKTPATTTTGNDGATPSDSIPNPIQRPEMGSVIAPVVRPETPTPAETTEIPKSQKVTFNMADD